MTKVAVPSVRESVATARFQQEGLLYDLTATLLRHHYDDQYFTATQPRVYFDQTTFILRCSGLQYDYSTLTSSSLRSSYDLTTFIIRPFRVPVASIVIVTSNTQNLMFRLKICFQLNQETTRPCTCSKASTIIYTDTTF